MQPFPLESDCLAGRDTSLRVTSFSWSGSRYKVSLADQTCSCPDFVKTRIDCPKDHFSRWCKHLIHAANKEGAFAECNEWHAAIAKAEKGGPTAAFVISVSARQEFLATIGSSPEWINVYAKTALPGERLPNLTGPIKQYGWNIDRKGWSYGNGPRGARELRKMLSQIEGITDENGNLYRGSYADS